jgi:hypothetical protein
LIELSRKCLNVETNQKKDKCLLFVGKRRNNALTMAELAQANFSKSTSQ